MIPSNFQRGGLGSRKRMSPAMMVAAALGVLVLLVIIWTLVTMGSAPSQVPVSADVAVKI